MWGLRPDLGFWAPDLTPEERNELGIPPDRLAKRVKWIPNRAAEQAGLRINDVFVSFDGRDERIEWGKLAVDTRLNYPMNAVVPIEVLRDGKRVKIMLPLRSDK